VLALDPITRVNWRATLEVRVAPGQLRFVADREPVAMVILSKAFVRVADLDWHPFAIALDGEIVGVVALVDERERDGCWSVYHLVIDARRQRQGIGRMAVRALIVHARSTGADRLRLTVHPENTAAIALYESEGFLRSVGPGADEGELDYAIHFSEAEATPP
jgi:ribosomal protein S18 acetylase RimI-like enzyme